MKSMVPADFRDDAEVIELFRKLYPAIADALHQKEPSAAPEAKMESRRK